jgi:hypothetical protein
MCSLPYCQATTSPQLARSQPAVLPTFQPACLRVWQPGSLPVSLKVCQSTTCQKSACSTANLPACIFICLTTRVYWQSAYKSVIPQLARSQPAVYANLLACIFMCLATRVSASQTTSLSVHQLVRSPPAELPTFQSAW